MLEHAARSTSHVRRIFLDIPTPRLSKTILALLGFVLGFRKNSRHNSPHCSTMYVCQASKRCPSVCVSNVVLKTRYKNVKPICHIAWVFSQKLSFFTRFFPLLLWDALIYCWLLCTYLVLLHSLENNKIQPKNIWNMIKTTNVDHPCIGLTQRPYIRLTETCRKWICPIRLGCRP